MIKRHSALFIAALIIAAAALVSSCAGNAASGKDENSRDANEIDGGIVTNGHVVAKLPDGHWWGFALYGGGKGEVYAETLNRFKELLGDSVNVYSMVIPTSCEYYLPETYSSYSASQQKSIDSIDSRLSGVTSVPASAELEKHTGEDIYLRTDYHWQPLGAYYAAKCFAETAGVPFEDISEMERIDIGEYTGTMYGFTESPNMLSDKEVFTYYIPSAEYTAYYYDTGYNYQKTDSFFIPVPVSSSYSMFMGGDDHIVRITTDTQTDRKLIVFKDSFGNAEIPFYFGSFSEIYVCDARNFIPDPIGFIQETGATDLLFTMSIFSAAGPNADELALILNRYSENIKGTSKNPI